jgi:tetratricopeptide (TPR) repeat protein
MRRLVALAAAGTLLLSITGCGGGRESSSPTAQPAATSESAASLASERSAARIEFLERRADGDPLDVFSLNELAIEHMQRARATGDVSSLSRASSALERSLQRQPDGNYEALALSASLAVAQHAFARGLDLAQQAVDLRPDAAYAYGAFGDALMGLGRYDEAAAAYADMHRIEPSLGSYSRLALLAQAYGRTGQALDCWREALAIADSSDIPEHEAWARAQIANLAFNAGNLVEAHAQYQASLAALPDYVHALAGLGRVAAARGDFDGAIAHYTEALAGVPLPEYAAALGDVYEAAGDAQRAADQYALVEAVAALHEANGVDLDLQIALFNADHHRDLGATVERARALYEAQPSIAAADALAWALYQRGDIAAARVAIAGALRTGTREPSILFHAGMIERASGDSAAALAHLDDTLRANPQFSVRHAPVARAAFDQLRLEAATEGLQQ